MKTVKTFAFILHNFADVIMTGKSVDKKSSSSGNMEKAFILYKWVRKIPKWSDNLPPTSGQVTIWGFSQWSTLAIKNVICGPNMKNWAQTTQSMREPTSFSQPVRDRTQQIRLNLTNRWNLALSNLSIPTVRTSSIKGSPKINIRSRINIVKIKKIRSIKLPITIINSLYTRRNL